MNLALCLFSPLAPTPQYPAMGIQISVNGDAFDFPVPEDVARSLTKYIVQPNHVERDLTKLQGGYYTMKQNPTWLEAEEHCPFTYCKLDMQSEIVVPADRLFFRATSVYFAASPALVDKLLYDATKDFCLADELHTWVLDYKSALLNCGGLQIAINRYERLRRIPTITEGKPIPASSPGRLRAFLASRP